ncbi:MAG: hypothetical protein ABJA69_06200 [Acidobacteriaceae bacterium]
MDPDRPATKHSEDAPSKIQTGLIVAGLIVALVLIFLPAYRVFFAVSVGIGLLVWGILYFWHKYNPLKEEDVHGKRPLGLD